MSKCNLNNEGNMPERMLYYWSRLFGNQLKSGNPYDKLQKTISVGIFDFELDNLKNLPGYCSKWKDNRQMRAEKSY